MTAFCRRSHCPCQHLLVAAFVRRAVAELSQNDASLYPDPRAQPLECLCATDGSLINGTIAAGCGAQGYGAKWCYTMGSNCTQSASGEGQRTSRWRFCYGYRCKTYFLLPDLQFLDLRVLTVTPSVAVITDWPECCAQCSLSEDCAAWRFIMLGQQIYQCELFLAAATNVTLVQAAAERLRRSAVQFDVDTTPLGREIYGLPGYDDAPHPCIGLRMAASLEDFSEGGHCLSLLTFLYGAGITCILGFSCCCCPWAWQWIHFARVVNTRGEVVPCLVTPLRVRHEWRSQENLHHSPAYEVGLSWDYPPGVSRELIFTGLHQTQDIFDSAAPREDLPRACGALPSMQVREAPQNLYELCAGEAKFQPNGGVWCIEKPEDFDAVQIIGLVDRDNPIVVMPVVADGGSGAQEMLRRGYALSFCLCGGAATLPLLTVAILKLWKPLLAEGCCVPDSMRGYNSAHTVSRWSIPPDHWSLSAVRLAAWTLLIASICFFTCCALPWWCCYARNLLSNVPEYGPAGTSEAGDRDRRENSDGDGMETTPLL